jgi:hypothetical protein
MKRKVVSISLIRCDIRKNDVRVTKREGSVVSFTLNEVPHNKK